MSSSFMGPVYSGCRSWDQQVKREKRISAPLHHAKPFVATNAMTKAWVVETPRLIKRADYLRGKR